MKNLKQLITIIALTLFVFESVNAQKKDFNAVGTYHNAILQELLPDLITYKRVHKTANMKFELKRAVKEKILNSSKFKGEFDKKQLENVINSLPDYVFYAPEKRDLLREIQNEIKISKKLSNLVTDAINFVNGTDDLNKIDSYVKEHLASHLKLSGAEENAYHAFLSTLKSSSYFWSPNGKDGFKYFAQDFNDSKEKGGPCIDINIYKRPPLPFKGQGIVIDDALGALGGSIGGFIGALVWGSVMSMSTALHMMQ